MRRIARSPPPECRVRPSPRSPSGSFPVCTIWSCYDANYRLAQVPMAGNVARGRARPGGAETAACVTRCDAVKDGAVKAQILTIFPELFGGPLATGPIRIARE